MQIISNLIRTHNINPTAGADSAGVKSSNLRLSKQVFASALLASLFITCLVVLPSPVSTENPIRESSQIVQANPGFNQDSELINTPHRIFAPHWSNEDRATTIYIRNIDIRQGVTARLSLVLKHRTFSLPETYIDSLQTISIDLTNPLLENGERADQSGGAFLDFEAESDSALVAYAQMINPVKGLMLNFPFLSGTTPAMPGGPVFPGPLEAVAWYFDRRTDAFIALQNTSDKPAVAIPAIFISGRSISLGHRPLKPREAITLRLPSPHLGREDGPRSAAVRVEYKGEPGAVEVVGWVENPEIGFSAPFTFHRKVADCQCPDGTRRLYGTGIAIGKGAMMGMAPDAIFSPYLAVANRSNARITIKPVFSYKWGEGIEAVALPPLSLNPQESRLVNLRDYQEEGIIPSTVNDGSIDLQYEGEAGALIAELSSVDENGTFVSPVPLTCNGQQIAEMAVWRTDDDWHSSLSLWNVAAKQMELEIKVSYPGGIYVLEKTLAPGATTMVSINDIQQTQEPDKEGRRIPADVTVGGVNIRSRNGVSGLVLNAMLVNPVTKTCWECGVYGYVRYCVLTDDIDSAATHKYTIHRQVDEDFFMYVVVTWSGGFQEVVPAQIVGNTNPSVATGQSQVTTLSPGTTTLTGRTYNDYPLDRNCTLYGPLNTTGDLRVHPRISVLEVGFKNDHKITIWPSGPVIDPNDSAPTWTSSNNPNHPVAYTRGAAPTIFAKLGINPSLSSSESASIRVKVGAAVIATKSNVTLSGSSIQITDIAASVLDTAVRAASYSFTWEISYDGVRWITLHNTGAHTFYWTYAAPLSPPFTNFSGTTYSPLYDLALQKACGYANGASDLGAVINNINVGVEADIFYEPSALLGDVHPLNAYTSPGCLCADLAALLRGLVRSIGIDGTVTYIWAGPNTTTMRRFIVGSTGDNISTFRIIRGAKDGAPQNPHFSYHAIVSTNGTWYDPSYGLSYSSLSFNETAFNNTPQQTSSTFPSFASQSGWVCPH